jgi:type I restriction enzyme S subunit
MENSLPRGWVEVALEDLVSPAGVFSDGDWVESKDQDPSGDVRLVQLADIGEMSFLDKSARFLTSNKAEQMRCLYIQKNDLLISRLGDPLGKACLYPAKDEKAVTAVDVCVFRPGNEWVDVKLVGFFLNSIFLRRLIDSNASGTTRKRITGKKLKSLPFRLPPLNEQKRIVSKIEEQFSDIDAGEAALRKAQKLLATYRQSILKGAINGELINSDPSFWQSYFLGDLITDIRYGTAKKCQHDPSKTPVLRIPNVVSGKIDLTDLKHTKFEANEFEKLKLKKGDVLLVRSNGSASLVGRSAVVSSEAEGCAYAGYLIRLRLKQDKLLPEFLHLFLHSPITRSHIERQARSTSGVHNINSDEVKNLFLKLPSIDEQLAIIDKVEDTFSQIETLENWCRTELARSATLRQSILKAAFAGQLVPQDPADEPASILLECIRAERTAQDVGQSKRGRRSISNNSREVA